MSRNRQECSGASVGHDAVLRPVVFLVLDDVLSLNAPFGGYDALLATGRGQGASDADCDSLLGPLVTTISFIEKTSM